MTIQIISIFLITLTFFLVFILLWINRKYFLNLFKNISQGEGAILVLIIVIFTLISIYKGYSLKAFIPADQEWQLLLHGKDLLQGKLVFDQQRYGLVYPVLLAFGYLLFGFNPLVASIMNLIFGCLSILLVFLISQAIFNRTRISLISTVIFAFTPLVFVYTNMRMGYPAILSFFLLSFSLTAILYFKYRKISLLALSLFLIALISQIKPEYFVLIVPFGLCYFLFKEYKQISFLKTIFLSLIFIILLIPYFIQNSENRIRFNNVRCGSPSQDFQCGFQAFTVNIPQINNLDNALKGLINGRISINYFVGDIPNFYKFWTFRSLMVISVLIMVGVIFSYKKHPREVLFLILIFSSISCLYMADCAFYESRFVIPSYGLVVIFSGFGIYFVVDIFCKLFSKKRIYRTVLLALTVLVFLFYWCFYEYIPNLFYGNYRDYLFTNVNVSSLYINYIQLNLLLKEIPKDNSLIFVVHGNSEYILKILGYESSSLLDIVNFNDLHNINIDTSKITLNLTKKNYYLQSIDCAWLPDLTAICKFVNDNYSLKLIKEVGEVSLFSLSDN